MTSQSFLTSDIKHPTQNPASLVQNNHVHRAVYTDPQVFKLEMERLFGRAWIYLAHESEIAKPGDFVQRHIGTQGVILSRAKDGGIHAIYNRCSHRGATLCSFQKGNSPQGHQCPYHGWVFAADGRLKSVPSAKNYDGVFDKEKYKIQEVAGLESYRGFIFGNLSEDRPALTDFLGHMTSSIDDLVDRSPTGEVEIAPFVLRHHYRANWKMTFENLNDVIHPGFAHAASVVSAKHVAGQVGGPDALVPTLGMMMANGKPISFFQNIDMVTAPNGHSFIGGHMGADYSPNTQDAYTQSLIAFHGEEKARQVLGQDRHLTLMYPSSTWHARYQTIRIVRPVRHDLTEVIGFNVRLKGAPEETFENAVEYCTGANSAASPVIADDLEIYERCLEGNQWSDQDWIPMTRGLAEVREETDAFNRHPSTAEAFIRNQFKAWAHYMGEV
ncbi:MAG: Rieske 2Fe-2S domain-containing protein [Pseudomonadota bacterium]